MAIFEAGVTFSKPSFWVVIHVSFRGCTPWRIKMEPQTLGNLL